MSAQSVAVPSARPTVRLALVLVAAQLLLCSLIGWFTFGDVGQPGRSRPAVLPLHAAPPPHPAPPVGLPDGGDGSRPRAAPAEPPAPPTPPESEVGEPTRRPAPAPGRAAGGRNRPPTGASPRADVPPELPPAGSPTPSPTTSPAPTSASPSPQLPLVAPDDACAAEGQFGRERNGRLLRCGPGPDGQLRWLTADGSAP